jgi:hypothetical protein
MAKRTREAADDECALPLDMWHLIWDHCTQSVRLLSVCQQWYQHDRHVLCQFLMTHKDWCAQDDQDDLEILPFGTDPNQWLGALRCLYRRLPQSPPQPPPELLMTWHQLRCMRKFTRCSDLIPGEGPSMAHVYLLLHRNINEYWLFESRHYMEAVLLSLDGGPLDPGSYHYAYDVAYKEGGGPPNYCTLPQLQIPTQGRVRHCRDKNFIENRLQQCLHTAWHAFVYSFWGPDQTLATLNRCHAMHQHRQTLMTSLFDQLIVLQ